MSRERQIGRQNKKVTFKISGAFRKLNAFVFSFSIEFMLTSLSRGVKDLIFFLGGGWGGGGEEKSESQLRSLKPIQPGLIPVSVSFSKR